MSEQGDILSGIRRNADGKEDAAFLRRKLDASGGQVYDRSATSLQSLSTPVGYGAQASGNRSAAFGALATAKEDGSVAVGIASVAAGQESVVVGEQSRVFGAQSTSVGQGSQVLGVRSVAVGRHVGVMHRDCIAIGNGVVTTKDGQVIIGTTSTVEVILGQGAVTNVRIGGSAALTTTATDGFMFIQSSPGVPTGVPTGDGNRVAVVYDSVGNRLYAYSGGAWNAL